MKYFVANWKANKNVEETTVWVQTFLSEVEKNPRLKNNLISNQIKVIICPPAPLLPVVKNLLNDNRYVDLGSQDISVFDSGSFTGEVTGYSLKDFTTYVIIGHSERRKFFQENDDVLFKKAVLAAKNGLEPIYCIRTENDPFPRDLKILAYEPESAIGTGENEDLKKVLAVKEKIMPGHGTIFLYGGSVDKDDVIEYLHTPEIDGFIVGRASLNPVEFVSLISKA